MLSRRLLLTPMLRGSLSNPRTISSLPFHVQRGPIQAPASPIHPNQRVECTWTIRATRRQGRQGRRHDLRTSSLVQPTAIEKLKVQTPGVTLVRIVPKLLETVGSDVVAQVRVSSNAATILKAVQITPRWPDRTVVQFQDVEKELFGNLLTEIDLPYAGALRNLAAMGYGDVVIGSDVLMNGGHDGATSWTSRPRRGCRGQSSSSPRQATVQLLATNQSRVFVDAPSTNLQLSSFKVGAVGSASQVHVNVAGLEIARSLELGALGGKRVHVAVHSDTLVASHVKLHCMGDGTTEMAVRKYADVTDIRALAIGSGVIRIETTARDEGKQLHERPRCLTQRISSIGTSCIDLATVPTSHATVNSLGAGDVNLQPRDALRVRSFGSSVIECVGRVPNALDVRGFPAPNLIETPTKTATDDETSTTTMAEPPVEPPTMEDAFHCEELLYSPCSASAMWSTSWNTSHGKY